MSYPEVLLLLHSRTKMTKMNIFRAANQTWGSSVEILYPYTISHFLTYEKPHMKTISIVGHSDHHTDIVIELALKFDAFVYTYVLIPEITILGWSDHQTDIMIEFPLKFDVIYILIPEITILG